MSEGGTHNSMKVHVLVSLLGAMSMNTMLRLPNNALGDKNLLHLVPPILNRNIHWIPHKAALSP
jgi:hypothetical protein